MISLSWIIEHPVVEQVKNAKNIALDIKNTIDTLEDKTSYTVNSIEQLLAVSD
ncbi:MAG: hypothetical protein K0Q53_2849, partial [Massilibacillus sp.]|nr:hypothetical protein [Massilibacillus sp.]